MHVSAQTVALMLATAFVETLRGDLRRVLVEEAPSERVLLSPLKLLLNEFVLLGSLPLKSLFPFLPSLPRSKWRSHQFVLRTMLSTKCFTVPQSI